MSGNAGGIAPTAGTLDPTAMSSNMQAQMAPLMAAQQQMFIESQKINEQQSEISTWGNVGENIAKNKPQV